MKVYLRRKRSDEVNAVGEYNIETGELVVLKNSQVSKTIHYTEKFRGASAIEKLHSQYVKDGIVICDAPFKSASTAANFVTGSSTNGLTAWKTETGEKLKTAMSRTSGQQNEDR